MCSNIVNLIKLCAFVGSNCNARNGECEILAIAYSETTVGNFVEIFVNLEIFAACPIYETAMFLERSQAAFVYPGRNNM